MRFYRPSKAFRITFGTICALVVCGCGLAIFDAIVPGIAGPAVERGRWIGLVAGAVMLPIFAYGIAETLRGGIGITSDTIVMQRAFAKRVLRFSEIRGYRQAPNGAVWIEGPTRRHRITVSQFLEHGTELRSWLQQRFINLDVRQQQDLERNLQDNPAYGATADEREHNLMRARRLARFVNWYGGLAALWLMLERELVTYAYTAAIIAPLLGLGVLVMNRGILRVDQEEQSPHPNIFACVVFAASAVFLRAHYDFQIADYRAAFKWTAMVAAALICILLFTGTKVARPTQRRVANYVVTATLLLLYSYCSVIAVNGMLDRSAPVPCSTSVIGKNISKGQFTTYTLQLAPVQGKHLPTSMEVGQKVFSSTSLHASIILKQKAGWLDIPWFYIDAK